MAEEICFSWWAPGVHPQRGCSSSRLALQCGRLRTCESAERARAVTSRYCVLQSRDGLSHLFSRPFTPVRAGRLLIMAFQHQLQSCTMVHEMENGNIRVFTNTVFQYPCACCGVTVRPLILLPHYLQPGDKKALESSSG